MDNKDSYRPIKVVKEMEWAHERNTTGGNDPKEFRKVTPEFRTALANQVDQVSSYFEESFGKHPDVPAVAIVTLRSDAIAKSHRPNRVFNEDTCPIISIDNIARLLVSVTRSGLLNLKYRINNDTTKSGKAALSTITTIQPYTKDDKYNINPNIEDDPIYKVKLFNHGELDLDPNIVLEFNKLISGTNIKLLKEYSESLRIYLMTSSDVKLLDSIISYVGVQSIEDMPKLKCYDVQSSNLNIKEMDEKFPKPETDKKYPKLGIIDSGTDPTDELLKPWVLDRFDAIPIEKKNYAHGSFVAGMAIHSRILNNDRNRFPFTPVKIYDVVVIGEDGTIAENELLVNIESALERFPDVRVWNISINSNDKVANNGNFSDLAITLDQLQDEYNVIFVISAGNTPILHSWPIDTDEESETFRVTSPGDSIRAITVGSLASLDSETSMVRADEPSPFSRRGPGGVFTPKPEVCQFGGNCDKSYNIHGLGVKSINGKGGVVEGIGTSYSAPIVASFCATIEDQLTTKPSLSLLKALTIHAAQIDSSIIDGNDLRYYGYGSPKNIDRLLNCTSNEVTMIIESSLRIGQYYVLEDFPIPYSMVNNHGKLKGEFIVTMVYQTPLDAKYGSEYCRMNARVTLGSIHPESGKYTMQVPPERPDEGAQYEINLVQDGFKWAPTKAYRRNIKVGAPAGRWQLKILPLARDGFSLSVPMETSVVITLRSTDPNIAVYDEMINLLNQRGWIVQDLEIKSKARIQANLQ